MPGSEGAAIDLDSTGGDDDAADDTANAGMASMVRDGSGGDGTRLRVSIDVSAVPERPGGAGRYVLSLVAALAARGDLDLYALCRRGDASRWQAIVPGERIVEVVPASRPLRLAWEQTRMAGLLSRLSVDVHHSPHYTMPPRSRVPVVVTIHDLTFFEHPEWHRPLKAAFFRRATARAVQRASALVCVSDRTAAKLGTRFAPRGQVFVAPHGIDRRLFGQVSPDSGSDDEILARLGVKGPYLLFVGTIEPRKAVPVLIGAFDRLAPAAADLTLVIAGGMGWDAAAVKSALASSPNAGRIVLTGFVEDREVAALMRSASACIYPAREEGFGMPVLEALSCGTPVVTTTATPAADLARGAVWVVGGDGGDDSAKGGDAGNADTAVPDPAALAATVRRVLDDDEERSGRCARGLSLASGWTWEASAAIHMEAYRSAQRGG